MKIYVGNQEMDTFELASSERQLWLQELYDSETKQEIRCGCNEKTPMHIKYFKKINKYFIATNPRSASAHEDWCELSLKLKERHLRGIHYRAIEELGPNQLSIHTKKLPIFISGGNKKTPSTPSKKRGSKHFTNSGITMGSLGRELLSRVWEYAIEKYSIENKFYPTIRVIQVTLNKLFLNPKLIQVRVRKDKDLSDVLWIGQNDPRSFYYYNKNEIRPFILAPLLKQSVIHSEDNPEYIQITVGGLIKEKNYDLNVPIETWEEAISYCRVNYNSHDDFFVVGVGEIGKYGELPKINAIELIPVTARGMFVDSSYEKDLFEHFENERRLYKRANQRDEELNGYLPDAILFDTEKPCIVEVFGMSESNKDYHTAKDRKMQYYRTMIHEYMTLYWHAYRNPNLPKLPPKKLQTKA